MTDKQKLDELKRQIDALYQRLVNWDFGIGGESHFDIVREDWIYKRNLYKKLLEESKDNAQTNED